MDQPYRAFRPGRGRIIAAVAGQLAAGGISCNVIAARYHDHVLVPHERAQQALSLMEQLIDPTGAR